jgi:hypothetical protein
MEEYDLDEHVCGLHVLDDTWLQDENKFPTRLPAFDAP